VESDNVVVSFGVFGFCVNVKVAVFVFPVVSFATASELSFAEYDTFTFCP
jgi:hypothetical protein